MVNTKTTVISLGKVWRNGQKRRDWKGRSGQQNNVNVFVKKDVLEEIPWIQGNQDHRPAAPFYFWNWCHRRFWIQNRRVEKEGVAIDPKYITCTNWLTPILGYLLPFCFPHSHLAFHHEKGEWWTGRPWRQIFNIGKSKSHPLWFQRFEGECHFLPM